MSQPVSTAFESAGPRGAVGGSIRRALRLALRRYPLGVAGGAILTLLFVIAAVPGLIATHDPVAPEPVEALRPVSRAHRFGTDNFGRDVFSRVVHATRGSLIVGVGAMLLGLGIGTLVGGVSAYAAGWVDAVLQRLVDAVLALPWLVLAMSVLALAGPGRLNTLLVIGGLTAPGLSRVIRGAVLRLRGMAFVDAARATGCPAWWILWRHLLPNIRSELIVLGSIGIGGALLSESALAFLGFGVVPPEPAWGYMLGVEGRRFLTTAPWLAIFPGVAIALVVCAATLVGDALRDAFDSRR